MPIIANLKGSAGKDGAAGDRGEDGAQGADALPISSSSWTGLQYDDKKTADAALNLGRGKQTGFWSSVDGNASVWRLTQRLFLGQATTQDDTRVGSVGWIPDAATGANWAIRDAQLGVMQTRGGLAVVGMSRASDGEDQTNTPASIGASGFAINDSGRGHSVWGLYSDVQHQPSVEGGQSYGIEIAAKNKGSDRASTPYFATYGVYGIWLPGGGDASYGGAPTNPSNAAIAIGTNSSTWNSGITFFDGALTRDPTFHRAHAIQLAANYQLDWWSTGNFLGFYINANVTSNGKGSSMLVLDNQITYQNQNGQGIVDYVNADFVTANHFNIKNAVAGDSVKVSAVGSDTNIDLQISPKGSGNVIVNGNLQVAGRIFGGGEGLFPEDGHNGEDGQPGATGTAGTNGSNGADGAAGAAGTNGSNGLQGDEGPRGEDGAPGPKGDTGLAGNDGRDGLTGCDGRDGDEATAMVFASGDRVPFWTRGLPYKANNWYKPPGVCFTATATPTANKLILFPFLAWRSFTIQALAARVTTQQAASNIQLAIYKADANYLPTGNAKSSTASIATTSATQVSAALGADVNINEGEIVWLAFNSDTASLVFCAVGGGVSNFSIGDLIGDATLSNLVGNQVYLSGLQFSQTFNTWPDLTGQTFTRLQNTVPAIFFQVR